MWKVADVVVEPSRSQVLYFRYYECGQDSEGKEIRGPQIAEACILSQALMNLKEGVCMTANLSFGNLRSKAMALGQDQEAQSVKKETRRHVYSLLQIHQHLHPRKGNAQ